MEHIKLTIEAYSDRPRVCRSAPDLRSPTRCMAEIIFHNENDEEEFLCKEHVAQRLRGNPYLLAAVNELVGSPSRLSKQTLTRLLLEDLEDTDEPRDRATSTSPPNE